MYGASSSIVVFMLTPFARPVISRIRCLDRSTAFGAMTRFAAVLKDRHAGGLGRVVLRGNVYPVIARGAGEDLGSGPGVFGDLALRHVRSPLRIGAESVRLRTKNRRNEDGEEFHSQQLYTKHYG